MRRKILVFMVKEDTETVAEADESLIDYHQVVKYFFDRNDGFKTVRKNLKKLLYGAFADEFLMKDGEVPTLMTLRNDLATLIAITGDPQMMAALGRLPVADDVFDTDGHMKPELYCGPLVENELMEWHYFPRFLGKKELADPARALRLFFEDKNPTRWNLFLDDLCSAALSHECILDRAAEMGHVLLLHNHLFKFIEATHLIHVRHGSRQEQPVN